MAIFLDSNSRVIVQGMTGSEGRKHTQRMINFGTKVVGGVTPGKAGQSVEFDDGVKVPVFGSVAEAVEATGANVSVIFVPAKFTKAAVHEAVDAKIPLGVVITEGVAVHDSAEFFQYAQNSGTAADRPELPRHHLARAVQRRHHPGQHHQAWPDRPGQQVRHADLSDDVRAAGHRLHHRCRYRW